MTRRALRWMVPLAMVAVLLAAGFAHLASDKPDGLERVAEQQDFANKSRTTARAPMSDYKVSALGGASGKTVAGFAGVLLTFGLVWGVGRLVAARRARDEPEPDSKDATAGPGA